jgi:hypothetical protein
MGTTRSKDSTYRMLYVNRREATRGMQLTIPDTSGSLANLTWDVLMAWQQYRRNNCVLEAEVVRVKADKQTITKPQEVRKEEDRTQPLRSTNEATRSAAVFFVLAEHGSTQMRIIIQRMVAMDCRASLGSHRLSEARTKANQWTTPQRRNRATL